LLPFYSTLLCASSVVLVLGRFMIVLKIFLDVQPCSGFVNKSGSMLLIAQNTSLTFPFFTLSVEKNIWRLVNLSCLILIFAIFANIIVLLLFWYTVVIGIYMPCDASKCLVYVPWRRQLSSDSVGLFALSFCLLESLYVAPLPIVMRMHVWLYKSGCITYNLSAHQIVLLFGSMVSIKFICVPNDCILISFFFSYLHECYYILHGHNRIATKWWNDCPWVSVSFLLLVLNSWSAAGTLAIPSMSGGNSFNIF